MVMRVFQAEAEARGGSLAFEMHVGDGPGLKGVVGLFPKRLDQRLWRLVQIQSV